MHLRPLIRGVYRMLAIRVVLILPLGCDVVNRYKEQKRAIQ